MIFWDLTVFTVFFGVILALRGQHPEMFASSQSYLHPDLGAVNTLVLLTSSLLVAHGVRLARIRDRRAPLLFRGALICAGAFAAIKVVEYTSLAGNGHGPGVNDFFMYYFTFTGIHLGHVVLGSVGLLVASGLAGPEHSGPRRESWLEVIGCFWHLVDLLWIVLFALLYLVR